MTLSQGTDAVVTFLVSGRARPVSPTWLQSPALARAQRADGAGEGRLAAGLVAVILILRDVGFSLAELDDQIAKAQTVQEAIDHVLGRFAPSERPLINEATATAVQAVMVWINQGIEACMNRFNADGKDK